MCWGGCGRAWDKRKNLATGSACSYDDGKANCLAKNTGCAMATKRTWHAEVSACRRGGSGLALRPATCLPPQHITHCDNNSTRPRMSDGCLIEDMPAVQAPA